MGMNDSLERFGLRGRLALVTGGASGIGRAICQRFAAGGATVIVADVDQSAGCALAKAIDGRFEVLDVTDAAAVETLATRLHEELGALDVLVANAGIVLNGPALETDVDDWRRVMDVNLSGVFFTARAFGRHMVAAGRGSVVCTSSMCSSIVVVPQAQIAYNASKAGVDMLSRSLAIEWAGSGVRVNAVAPGYTATELTLAGRSRPDWFDAWLANTPMGRLGTPEEIADCVQFLASDAAGFVTGSVLAVDGGYTAR